MKCYVKWIESRVLPAAKCVIPFFSDGIKLGVEGGLEIHEYLINNRQVIMATPTEVTYTPLLGLIQF